MECQDPPDLLVRDNLVLTLFLLLGSIACEVEGETGVGWWREYVGKVIPPETSQHYSSIHVFYISSLSYFKIDLRSLNLYA